MTQEQDFSFPENFSGVFNFTNWTDEDFSVLWNSIEYTFAAKTTSPIIIPGESLESIQNIRKFFAKKLAEKVFYSSKRYDELNSLTGKSGGVPALFNEDKEFAPYIQKCLEPLPAASAKMKQKAVEQAETSEHTSIVTDKDSLKGNAQDVGAMLDSIK